MKFSNLQPIFWRVAILVPVLGLFLAPIPAQALEIKDTNVEIRDDFVLEPAKQDIVLDPGEKTTKSLSIVNRTDREQTFTIQVEDFTGSRDLNQVVVLLGNDKGPYSLRDLIKPEVKSFRLKPRQRAIMDVNIAIPLDAEPGGKFASVLVSSEPVDDELAPGESRARTISRLGALYLVRVSGKVNEDASLKGFRLTDDKTFYEKGPFNFELLFENNSSVHLVPQGRIEVKNILGKKVADLEVVPFFSLPASLRAAQITWDSSFAFGRYTATATIDRGYKENADVTDTLKVSFWVLPWKIVVGFLVVIILVAWILRKLVRSFEIKRKK